MVVNDELVESPNILFITRRPNRSNSKWLEFLPPDVVQCRRLKSQPRTVLLQSYVNMPFQLHVRVWRSLCAIHMPNIRTPSLIWRRCDSNFQPCLTFNSHHILKTTNRLSKEVSYPLFRNRDITFKYKFPNPETRLLGSELLKKSFTRNPRKFVIPYFLPKRKASVMLQMAAASSGRSWHPKEARRSKSGWFLFQVRAISISGGARGSLKCKKMLRKERNEEWEKTEVGSLMLMSARKKTPRD